MRLPRQSCTPSGVWRCCNGRRYNSRIYRCCYGHVMYVPPCYLRCVRPIICGNKVLNPLTGHACCRSGNQNTVYYRPSQQCCYGRLISSRERCLPRCGGRPYFPPTQRCCGTRIYWPAYLKCCNSRSSQIVFICRSCPSG